MVSWDNKGIFNIGAWRSRSQIPTSKPTAFVKCLTKMEIGAARDNGQKWCTLVWSWKHRSIKERNNEKKKKKKKAHALSWNRKRDSRMVMHACLELREKLEHRFGVIKERWNYKKKRKRNKYLCGLWLIWSHRRGGECRGGNGIPAPTPNTRCRLPISPSLCFCWAEI